MFYYLIKTYLIFQLSDSKAQFLLFAEGFSQFISRLLSGFLFDRPSIKNFRSIIFGISVLLTAVSSIGMNILIISRNSFISLFIMYGLTILRGIGSGTIISQTNIILLDLCSYKNLPKIMGFISFFKGIGFLVSSFTNG